MKRWRTSDEHANDPGRCPVCHYAHTIGTFSYDGAESWIDDSCDRCGATWQTLWKATGYVGLQSPAFPAPDLRDVARVWAAALREIFPLGHSGASLLGRLRTEALRKTWGISAPSDGDRPLVKFEGHDVALDFSEREVGDLYGLASKFLVERLLRATNDGVLKVPTPAEMSAALSERGYSVAQLGQHWVFKDEDGLAVPIEFDSESNAQIGAWLHASAILPTRPEWGDKAAGMAESELACMTDLLLAVQPPLTGEVVASILQRVKEVKTDTQVIGDSFVGFKEPEFFRNKDIFDQLEKAIAETREDLNKLHAQRLADHQSIQGDMQDWNEYYAEHPEEAPEFEVGPDGLAPTGTPSVAEMRIEAVDYFFEPERRALIEKQNRLCLLKHLILTRGGR